VIEWLWEGGDITVNGRTCTSWGRAACTKVYVVDGGVWVVGDDAPARAVDDLLARLEGAMLLGKAAWWTDFCLVASILSPKRVRGADI